MPHLILGTEGYSMVNKNKHNPNLVKLRLVASYVYATDS